MSSENVVIGIGAGISADLLWNAWPGHGQFTIQAVEEKSPLAFLEHYHWGLASFIVAKNVPKHKDFFNGVGVALVGSEFFQENPFGIGKSEFEQKGNFITVVALGALLAYYSSRK